MADCYTGDNYPLKFTCEEDGAAVTPTAANVTILKPSNKETAETAATISSDKVSYSVPTTVTTKVGTYKAYFVLTISGAVRTHCIEFEVKNHPERWPK